MTHPNPDLADRDERAASLAHGLSRRELAHRAGGALVASSALASFLAACGDEADQGSGSAGKIGGDLALFTWAGYADRKAAAPFTNKHHVSLKPSVIGAPEELLTKLKAGGTSRYALVTPAVFQAPQLVAAGVLQPLDFDRLPNTQYYLPQMAEKAEQFAVGGKKYVAPYLWGMNACIYDKQAIPEPPDSWMEFTTAKYKKRLGLVDNPVDNLFTWAPLLGYDPLHLSPDELDEVIKFLIDFKRTQVRTLSSTYDDFADQLTRGDIDAVATQLWIAVVDIAHAKGGASVAWCLPSKAGGTIWTDGWSIPSDAPNLDTAYAFANYMIGVPAQTVVAPKLASATVNAKAVAKLPRDAQATYPYEPGGDVEARTVALGLPAGENGEVSYEDCVRAWARVQAA